MKENTKKAEYVDCICITENRSALLKKSIGCFQKQDYASKRLSVFFVSSDRSTKEFVEKNPQYNRVQMEFNPFEKTTFRFEAVADATKSYDSFEEGEQFFISIGDDLYLKANEEGSVGIGVLTEEDNSFRFSLKKNEDGTISIYTIYNTWLKAEQDGTLTQANTQREWETFIAYSINGAFHLLSWHEFAEQSKCKIKIDNLFLWTTTIQHKTDSDITFVELKCNFSISLGEKRNIASMFVKGDYLCVWDDDDWHNPIRISCQVESLKKSGKSACTLSSIYIYNAMNGEAYVTRTRIEGWEGTLLCKRSEIGKYEHLAKKEDTVVLEKFMRENKIVTLDRPYLYIYHIHQTNTSNLSHFNYITRVSYRVAPTEDQFVRECFV